MSASYEPTPPFAIIPEAVEDFRSGRMIIIVDDEDRENEGDLACAAEKVTPEIINFMAKEGRGLICLSLTEERCDQLELPLQVRENTSRFETAFCVTVDARDGVTTGISAADRAKTILTAVDPRSKPSDLVRPGHTFPLRARKGGVLVRAGQTEASVDLARMAGLTPAGVICEIMDDDGTMARLPQLVEFARRHGLKVITVADLIRYRLQHELLVRKSAEAVVPTVYGEFRVSAFENALNEEVHLALVLGEVADGEPPLVRVHTQSVLGDIFGSLRDEVGLQLHLALERIAQDGRGVLLYLIREENLGEGLVNQVRKHHLMGEGKSAREAAEQLGIRWDMRDYGIGAQILYQLGVRRMRLLTNHPKRLTALAGFGLQIVEFIPLSVDSASMKAAASVKRENFTELLAPKP
jgi:3,4-dihydroxy 2-butanone 4-phosphate synthase/GTP cyclohydrolase II